MLSISLSQASGVPYYRQIFDQLGDLIRSGHLPPGTQLPSFRELAPQLLVSLITVRRAYEDLEKAGLIVCRQGQGTFVAEGIETSSRKESLAEARALLASTLARVQLLGLRGEALRAQIERLIEPDVAGEAGARGEKRTQKGRMHGHD